jgi:hypothetical protein
MLTAGKLHVKRAMQRANKAFALESYKTTENFDELVGHRTFGMQTEF